MTTSNDAPRPTSDLVKRLLSMARDYDERAWLVWSDLCREAAASLQSLEARNKELEGALDGAINLLDALNHANGWDKESAAATLTERFRALVTKTGET